MKNTFLFFLIIISLFPAVKAVPELPNQFYGIITYLGSTIPDGHKLTAKLGEEEFTMDIIDGQYGIEKPLLVSKDSSDSINEISFYINYVKISTQDYHPGELTELNLDIPSNIVIIKETTIKDLKLRIGGSEDLSKDFAGVQVVEFKEGDKLLVKFDYDFNSHSVNELLYNLIIKKQEETSANGAIIIKGAELPLGKTKTVYIDNLNKNTNQVCIKDAEISSITEISGQCNAADETLLTCPRTSNTKNGYTCTDLGDYYQIEGLKHSGVIETEPFCGDGTCNSGESCSSCTTDCGTCPVPSSGGGGGTKLKPAETKPSCKEISRTCNDWSVCTVLSRMSRSCDVVKDCNGQVQTKLEWEEQPCTYKEPEKQAEQPAQEPTTEEPAEEQKGIFSRLLGGIRNFPATTGAVITEKTGFEMTGQKSWIIPIAMLATILLFIAGLKLKVYRRIKQKFKKEEYEL